jgi:DNA excision repair protein ERCC-2
MEKRISLSVREFALPVPRTGSIDAHSGYGTEREDGIEIHQRVQARRAEEHDTYEAEVPITHEFEHGGYTFKVSGRMDGFFDDSPPVIEEIKSTFSIHDLQKKLSAEHPYTLQLQTYGYIHWLKTGVLPKLSFHLVSTRNFQSDDLDVELDPEQYQRWLDRRLEELASEARQSEKRAARRRKLSHGMVFPFERPRTGQVELIQQIEKSIEYKARIMVQAPTGLGKTVGVLYPTLKDALARGQRVIYATPKNSQHSVAEDAIDRFKATGSPVKSLTMTAKSKICFKAEPLCNPEYCEYAKDHYTKVYENKVLEQLEKKRKLTSKTFRQIGEEYQVCPFELQLDAAVQADTIICDYNYVFAPRSALGRIARSTIGQEGKPSLVIDEAHNLPSRAMDYYSPELSSITLERMREELKELPVRFQREAEEILDECIQTILACKPPETALKSVRIQPPAEPFLEQEAKIRSFLSRYLESDVEIRPRDVILRMSFYWAEFTGALEYVANPATKEFFTTFHSNPSGGIVRISCSDASQMLKPCYDDYEQVVAFSATLKPFEYYAKLSGLDPATTRTEEFRSPFDPKQRKLMVIPQISTKYAQRDRNAPRIAEVIQRVSELKPGNYFAFFPSFAFMDQVLAHFEAPKGFLVLRQDREMKQADIQDVIEGLKSQQRPTLVFAVQGGVFSEGVDYPGDTIIGAFVVGPPLPVFDLEQEEKRKYYDETYGNGFDFAYTYPAMAKAVQAAGRVIRTETDRGLIVLMDSRFIEPSYSRVMPQDWYQERVQELVPQSIIKEVTEFWEKSQGSVK